MKLTTIIIRTRNDSKGTKRPLNRCTESEKNHVKVSPIKRFRTTSAVNEYAWDLPGNMMTWRNPYSWWLY